MKRLASALVLASATALLPFGAAPALAQEPVHVTSHMSFPTVTQGGFQSSECAVENTGSEPVLVIISPSVTYADGEVQRFRLNQGPTALAPGDAFVLNIGYAVPEDAALGTATFTCEVRAVGAGGGGVTQSASSTFEVVPA